MWCYIHFYQGKMSENDNSVPKDITLRDVYELVTGLRSELKESMSDIREEMRVVRDTMTHLKGVVDVFETRISKLEDEFDAHVQSCQTFLNSLPEPDEFPPECTVICSGLRVKPDLDKQVCD